MSKFKSVEEIVYRENCKARLGPGPFITTHVMGTTVITNSMTREDYIDMLTQRYLGQLDALKRGAGIMQQLETNRAKPYTKLTYDNLKRKLTGLFNFTEI